MQSCPHEFCADALGEASLELCGAAQPLGLPSIPELLLANRLLHGRRKLFRLPSAFAAWPMKARQRMCILLAVESILRDATA